MKGGYNLALKEGFDFTVRRRHWLPQILGVDCLAFGKTLYFRRADGGIPKHEFLHLAQFHQYGVARVVLHYLFHVARNYRRYGNFRDAFREVPFEREAREFEAGGLRVNDKEDASRTGN
jgi:hypothetical protein